MYRELCQPFGGIARFYEGQGLYNLAEPWREQCLLIVQNRLSIAHPTVDVAGSLHDLATLYTFQGRYSETESLFLQALELRKPLSPEDYPEAADSLHGLANVYRGQGRYTEAETFFLRALELRKRLLGDNHPLVADSLNDLALLYRCMGRYSEAEILYDLGLEMRKRLLGSDHLDVANSLNQLASLLVQMIYLRRCDNSLPSPSYAKAESLLRQSLELKKRVLSNDHPQVAENLNNLAMFYYAKGHSQKAEPLYKQALDIWQRSLGTEHPNFAEGLTGLAMLYLAQGRYHKAEPLFVQALEIYRHSLREDHPDVAIGLNNLAVLYLAQGRYHKAESFLIRSLELGKQKLGANHPTVVMFYKSLAAIKFHAMLHGLVGLFILGELLSLLGGGFPGVIIATVIWMVVGGRIYPFLLLILLAVIPVAVIFQWEVLAAFLALFFSSLMPIGIGQIMKRSRFGYRINILSSIIWLSSKTLKFIFNYT